MPTTCYTGTAVPHQIAEECNGEYTSDACIIHTAAIPYLNLPANSPLQTIINSFIAALQYKDEQIETLQNQIDEL